MNSMPSNSPCILPTATLAIAALVFAGCYGTTQPSSTSAATPTAETPLPSQTPPADAKENIAGKQDIPGPRPPGSPVPAPEQLPRAADNSGQNAAASTPAGAVDKTPFDQGTSDSDIGITRGIRKLVTDAEGMSINGQNIKIITKGGVVVLRGPVASTAEAQRIVTLARQVPMVARIDDQLAATQLAP